MLRKILATTLFLILPLIQVSAHGHHGVTGVYSVSGVDPITGPYIGSAVITQNGPVLEGTWVFPDAGGPIIEPATGFVFGNVVTFVYLFEGSYGAATYNIRHGGSTLDGEWVQFEGAAPGFETLTLISEDIGS